MHAPLASARLAPESELLITESSRPLVSWGAILAGLITAMGVQVVLMMLGAGLGFALYNPLSDANPVAELGAGAIVVQGISAVLSLWLGGWVAGRFLSPGTRATGGLHGFTVWCAATVAGVLIVSLGAGWALGDLSKIVGGGLSLAGKPAAAAVGGGAADMAKDAAKQTTDMFTSFGDEAVGNLPANSAAKTTVRAKREVGQALARMFSPLQKDHMVDNRAVLVKSLVDTTNMSESDADRLVTSWTDTYKRLEADLVAAKDAAEVKAREAADKAAKALTMFSLGAFVAFVLGGVAAGLGGRSGARHALLRTVETN